MFTISLVNPKGGSAKTTMTIGIAVAAARAGYTVAVIDVDPQASVAKWKDRREIDDYPAVVSAQASRLRPTLEAARVSGVDFAFIDTAGRNDDSALLAARVSDLVLIPTRPNIIEMEVLGSVNDVLRLAGSPPALVVMNGIHPTATKQAEEARLMVEKLFGLATCPMHICHRNAYAEALTTGEAPQELDPDGRAAIELGKLFEFVCEFVNNRRSEHGERVVHSKTA
jgi:chromosome partitioning protein